MSTLTTAKLLGLTRRGKDTAPPAGFVAVPADRLTLPLDVENVRINYQAFFNPTTNELVITGTPKPQMLVRPGQAAEDGRDIGIFHDSPRSPTVASEEVTGAAA